MVDNICDFLTKKIRKEMPEIDDERAEVINYGLQNIIGEIPKTILVLLIAYFAGIFTEALMTCLMILPYKACSGGFHLKTHIGCIIGTTIFYCGIPLLAKYLIMPDVLQYILTGIIWIFGMIMIRKYAPADTENVPILSKKDRKRKQILSYIFFTLGLIASILVTDNTISNILLIGNLLQTFTITRFAYKLTNNKYGYEEYQTGNLSV